MLEQLSILENNRELRDNGLIKRYVMLEFYDYLEHNKGCTLEEIKIELENDIRDYKGNTTLHKWTRARAEIFYCLSIRYVRHTLG